MMASAWRRRRNSTVLAGLLLIVATMGTLAYYSVPLYRLFCEVTGFGGTTRAAKAGPAMAVDREITVRFDANVASGLPWRFAAPTPVPLRPGEEREFTVSFFVDPGLAGDPNAKDVSTVTLSYTFFDQGMEAHDRYMRENGISYRRGPPAVDTAAAVHAPAGSNPVISARTDGSRGATPGRVRQPSADK